MAASLGDNEINPGTTTTAARDAGSGYTVGEIIFNTSGGGGGVEVYTNSGWVRISTVPAAT